MKKYKLGTREVAQILDDFLEGTGSRWAWDDFISAMSVEKEHLEQIRIKCAHLGQEFPSDKPHEYCNEQGRFVIRDYVNQLRASK